MLAAPLGLAGLASRGGCSELPGPASQPPRRAAAQSSRRQPGAGTLSGWAPSGRPLCALVLLGGLCLRVRGKLPGAHCPLGHAPCGPLRWAGPRLLRIRPVLSLSPRERSAHSPFAHVLLLPLPPRSHPDLTPRTSPPPDVLDMVDVLVEGSEGLDEEIGCSLSEDTALLAFPFSPVAPAALEARNKLLLAEEREAGAASGGGGGAGRGSGGAPERGVSAENPPKRAAGGGAGRGGQGGGERPAGCWEGPWRMSDVPCARLTGPAVVPAFHCFS